MLPSGFIGPVMHKYGFTRLAKSHLWKQTWLSIAMNLVFLNMHECIINDRLNLDFSSYDNLVSFAVKKTSLYWPFMSSHFSKMECFIKCLYSSRRVTFSFGVRISNKKEFKTEKELICVLLRGFLCSYSSTSYKFLSM